MSMKQERNSVRRLYPERDTRHSYSRKGGWKQGVQNRSFQTAGRRANLPRRSRRGV